MPYSIDWCGYWMMLMSDDTAQVVVGCCSLLGFQVAWISVTPKCSLQPQGCCTMGAAFRDSCLSNILRCGHRGLNKTTQFGSHGDRLSPGCINIWQNILPHVGRMLFLTFHVFPLHDLATWTATLPRSRAVKGYLIQSPRVNKDVLGLHRPQLEKIHHHWSISRMCCSSRFERFEF